MATFFAVPKTSAFFLFSRPRSWHGLPAFSDFGALREYIYGLIAAFRARKEMEAEASEVNAVENKERLWRQYMRKKAEAANAAPITVRQSCLLGK